MSSFAQFKEAVRDQLLLMSATNLFEVDLDKDLLWDTYLDSFPAGTNNVFRERREYDCTCCKQFIRNIGRVVSIASTNELISVWDIQVGGYYQPVVDAMAALVKSRQITEHYFNDVINVGTDKNSEMINGVVKSWDHFHFVLPQKYALGAAVASTKGDKRTAKEVFQRSMTRISKNAIDIVVEMIEQDSIYRGEEHLDYVRALQANKAEYDALPEDQRDNFSWKREGRFRATVISTLLEDITEGVELDKAVRSFEAKVAPQNYKRPKPILTKSMIEKAQKRVIELGLENSLQRRYAVETDLTINNVLFADRSVKKAMNAFDDLIGEVKVSSKVLDKVEEISIADFIKNVLPKAETLEVMVANNQANNMFSLIAPCDATAPGMFTWGSPFSWSYNGEVADSIKERVKAAGGNVEGVLRASLSWFNNDDLDLHMYEPDGQHIYFPSHSRRSTAGGQLDIDMNGSNGMSKDRKPVENIFYQDESRLKEGRYRVAVNNYNMRERADFGFELELEFKGQIWNFSHDKVLNDSAFVTVVEFNYSRKDGLTVIGGMESTSSQKEIWGIQTNTFQKVSMVLNSPNHWDGEKTGNKHYFFALQGCRNPGETRGFYNEFLKPELAEDRKVFEMLGAKMKAPYSDNQISGVGFSSTRRDNLIVKVGGSFNRTLKIMF